MNVDIELEESKLIVHPRKMVPEDSFKEFPGFDEWDYSDMLEAGELTPYALRKIIKWKNGKIEAVFHRVLVWGGGYNSLPDFGGYYICFIDEEVKNILKKYPELTESKVIKNHEDYDYDFSEEFGFEESQEEEILSGSQTKNKQERIRIASEKRQENILSMWKKVIPAMMKVYHRCMIEGEKPRQGPDFNCMFNELNAELTDTQMAFFRSCLPEGYKDTEGGKPGKV